MSCDAAMMSHLKRKLFNWTKVLTDSPQSNNQIFNNENKMDRKLKQFKTAKQYERKAKLCFNFK